VREQGHLNWLWTERNVLVSVLHVFTIKLLSVPVQGEHTGEFTREMSQPVSVFTCFCKKMVRNWSAATFTVISLFCCNSMEYYKWY